MKDDASLKAKTVAANIRKIRDLRNYSQDYLAAKLGISQNAFSKIELGYSKITLERLFDISMILEVDVMQVLNFNNTESAELLNLENNYANIKVSHID